MSSIEALEVEKMRLYFKNSNRRIRNHLHHYVEHAILPQIKKLLQKRSLIDKDILIENCLHNYFS